MCLLLMTVFHCSEEKKYIFLFIFPDQTKTERGRKKLHPYSRTVRKNEITTFIRHVCRSDDKSDA